MKIIKSIFRRSARTLAMGTCLLAMGAFFTGCVGVAHSHDDVPVPRVSDLKTVGKKGDDLSAKMLERAKTWIETAPKHPKGYNALGLALMQQGRETGELDHYTGALTAFEKAVELAPKDSESLHNLAYSWTMFHRFDKAIKFANEAIAANPNDPFAYGVLTDSYVELGQYDKAADAAQSMVSLRPDLASYSRAAQIRWILGDPKGAMLIMERAVKAGGAFAENTAWCQTQLGDMYWKTGALKPAEQQYTDVLKRLPEFRHAKMGLAVVRASQGKLDEAAELMESATAVNPPIAYVIHYGDLLTKMGKAEEAEAQYNRVEKLVEEHLAHGIMGDEVIQSAFYADHDRKIPEALELARSEVKEHTSWQSYAALAWAEYKSGNYPAAKAAMDKALENNIQEAKLWYRAGKIAEKLGDAETASRRMAGARNLNPHFDVLHPEK